MPFKSYVNSSRNIFWFLVILLWLASTIVDRIWWNFFSDIPAWDQADYLNSALDHARALSFLGGEGVYGFKSFLDLSPKIPPLASIVNGSVMSISGQFPHEAAWSLSLWNGFLIFNVASWGLYLKGKRFSLISIFILVICPFIFHLRTDYVLELPLISATTFYLFQLGKWSDPVEGGKWSQVILATLAGLSSLLIKQSALLVIIPSLLFVFFVSIERGKGFRFQLLFGIVANLIVVFPWFYHSWIMILSGTYRAVIESASIEGDPSILNLKSIFWYFPLLPNQIGNITFLIGLSGLALFILKYLKFNISSLNLIDIKLINYSWTWLLYNLCFIWIFTTFIPNKDPRYIASTIPLIILLLSFGLCEWINFLDFYFGSKFRLSYLLLIIFPFSLSFFSAISKFKNINYVRNKYYPIDEIINEVRFTLDRSEKTTIIVVPSTPELNQHNISFFGRMDGENILGRQLGQSLSHIKPVLNQAKWIVLAEGDQGSVTANSVLLDRAIRDSGLFVNIRQFPRKTEGSYSLWRRSLESPITTDFANRFAELAIGMENGPLGIKNIFDEIAIQHMIDGHFIYRSSVMKESIKRLSSDSSDVEARWSLSLLAILANRPHEADSQLKILEEIIPSSPWPSVYRGIVNLYAWKPLRASMIFDSAYEKYGTILLKGLGDASSVLGGSLNRLPSAMETLPKAIDNINKISDSVDK